MIGFLQFRKKLDQCTWVALFDLKKAFDSIDHDILLNKLNKVFKNHRKELLIAKWILSAASIKIQENRKKININLGCP